jgi:prepilin peptidase CpaA
MITDTLWGKIYNWITFPLIFIGWILNFHYFGLTGFGYSLGGTIIGIAVYFGFAMIGAIGMGDVKLMGAVGSLCGTSFVVNTFLFTSVIGLFHGTIIQILNYGPNAFYMLLTSFSTKAFLEKTIKKENEKPSSKYKFYLGIDILLAAIITYFFEIKIRF